MEAFAQINRVWLTAINQSAHRKHLDFDRYADPIWQLYMRPENQLMIDGNGVRLASAWEVPDGCPRINVNKPHQLRSVFLPFLHHKNPKRTETEDRRPKVPPDLEVALADPAYIANEAARHYLPQLMPYIQGGILTPPQSAEQVAAMADAMAQQGVPIQPFDPTSLFRDPRADAAKQMGKILLGGYLDYTPNELNLKGESYEALTDGLLPGRGVMWTEAFETTRGTMVGSFHVPIRDFFVDPDHQRPRDWQFIVRRRRRPKWEVAKEFGIPESELIADGKTTLTAASEHVKHDQAIYNQPVQEEATRSQDLVTYYEVYSRCGVGEHFVQDNKELQEIGRRAGHCVRIVVSEANRFPLNMRPELLQVDDETIKQQNMDQILKGLEWPVKTYRDPTWPWPCSILDFHSQSGSPWPFAHLRGVLDKLDMLNWIYSHVCDGVQKSNAGKWLLDEKLDGDVQKQLMSMTRELFVKVRRKQNEPMQNLVHFMQAPNLNADLWQVAMILNQQIDEDTGLTSLLLSGTSENQWRSSAEAQIKERKSESRPDAMADTYDDFQGRIARNEAIAVRTKIDGGTIAKYFDEQGPPVEGAPLEPGQPAPPIGRYTQYWMTTVYSPDIDKVLAETDWRIESGSMRKPNHQQIQQSLVEVAQNFLPYFVQQAQAGDPHNLGTVLDAWSNAGHLPPFNPNMPAPPPMPVQQPQQGPPPKKSKNQQAA